MVSPGTVVPLVTPLVVKPYPVTRLAADHVLRQLHLAGLCSNGSSIYDVHRIPKKWPRDTYHPHQWSAFTSYPIVDIYRTAENCRMHHCWNCLTTKNQTVL